MSELVRLRERELGGHQVVLAMSDYNQPVNHVATSLADAVHDLMEYRERLGVENNGVRPSRDIVLIGHSFGVPATQLMLQRFVERGQLHDHEGSIFDHVNYLGVDGAWRGFDVPKALETVARFPNALKVIHEVLLHAPGSPIAPGTPRGLFSVTNGLAGMRQFSKIHMPYRVDVHYAPFIGEHDSAPFLGQLVPPINNWYSSELGHGEIERLQSYLRNGPTGLHDLDGRIVTRIASRSPRMRTVFANLRAQRDANPEAFERLAAGLTEAAQRTQTPEEFAEHASVALGADRVDARDAESLRSFLRGTSVQRLNTLDRWSSLPMTRHFGLQQLVRALQRDANYARFAPQLRAAALESNTPEEFARRYDAILHAMLPLTYTGRHTDGMFPNENPTFVHDVAKVLRVENN
jgi:hypothetical protein